MPLNISEDVSSYEVEYIQIIAEWMIRITNELKERLL